MTFEDARAAFPALERYAYLNAGSVGPMARRTYDALVATGEEELGARGGIEAFKQIMEGRERLRTAVAAQIGVEPKLVANMNSTSEGCRVVLAGLDLASDDEIVTTDSEHYGLLGPVHGSGATVRVAAVRDRPADEALDAILAEVGPKTKLIALSHVLWQTGHVVPIAELKEAVSAPLLVDGAQSVGAIPVEAEPYDFYTVSGQKWLCGPTPTGGLYVRDPERLRVGAPAYFAQKSHEPDGSFEPTDGARRFERSWIPASFIAGLEAAVSELPEWRFERSREVSERCRERLLEAGYDVATEGGHANLVSWRWDGDPRPVAEQLYGRDVVIRDLPGTDLLRASCGYWTSEDDLDRLVEGLAGV